MNIQLNILKILPILVLFFAVTPVEAASFDEFRKQGIIAERFDGYVETRLQGRPAAERIVEQVNAQRHQVYQRRADEQGVAKSEVEKVYAEQIFRAAPAGTYFRRSDGSYVQK